MNAFSGRMRTAYHGESSPAGYFADAALLDASFWTVRADGTSAAPMGTEFGHVSALASSDTATKQEPQRAIQIGTDFVVSGDRWTHNTITWSFATANYTNQQGTDFTNSFPVGGTERALIAQAFSIWDAASPYITFQQVADGPDVDIRLGWGENLVNTGSGNTLGEAWNFTSGTNTLYSANDIYGTLTRSLIRIDRADTYSDLGGTSADKPFLNVALHEIGHALGLAHYDLQTAIMNTYASNMTSLTSHETNGVNYLYPTSNPGGNTGGDYTVTITGVSTTSVSAGQTVTVNYRISNVGNQTANTMEWRFYLSQDTTISPTNETVDRQVGTGYVLQPLAAGASQTGSITFTVPSGISGTWYLGMVADYGNYVTEANESNNVSNLYTFQIAAGPPNRAPVVTAPQANVTASAGQTIALTSLFSASDADGDALTYYVYDSNGGASSGRVMLNGTAIPAATIYQMTAAQFAQATFVAGAAGNTDSLSVQVFDGQAYSGWNTSVNVAVPTINHAPVVTAPQANVTATAGQTIALSSLFRASDSDGDALTYYVYDSNGGANSGRVMLNGTVIPASTIYQMTAAQFAQATFVAGAAGNTDDISVQVFDGRAYSGWNTSVRIAVANPNHAPVVTAPQANVTATAGQTIALSSLFSASDSDGDPLTYYVYDGNSGANSGRIVLNGTALLAATIYPLSAAQFAQATFVAGSGGNTDDISVQVSDGKAYSGWNTSVRIAVPNTNHAPVVTAPQANVTATAGQTITVSSLFSASDSDGDTLTYYLYDSNTAAASGRFMVNGTAVAAQTIYPLTAAQFAQTTFVAGAAGNADDILVQVFDGQAYSGWNTTVKVNVPSGPADDYRDGLSDTTAALGQITVNGTRTGNLEVNGDRDWFAVQLVANVNYTFNLQGTTGGGGTLADPILRLYGGNGVVITSNDDINGSANRDSQFTYRPATGGTYYLEAGGYNDGYTGTYRIGFTAPVNQAPVVTAVQANVTATAGQTFAISSLFTASDGNGDTLTYYLYDSNTAAGSGRFMVNGAAVPAQTIYQLTAAQFAQTTFVAGTGGATDDISVQAFDGQAYSGWNTTVKVSVPNHAPTVSLPSGTNVSFNPAQSIAVSSLFLGNDSDGDALTYYLYDSNAAANSGRFMVGGNVVPANTIQPLTAAQFAQATFVTGVAGTFDDLLVQTFDGKAYSGWNASVHVSANQAPTIIMPSSSNVSTAAGQPIQLSALFSGRDLDGDTLSYYVYDSNAATNSGYFVVGGNVVPANTITPMSAAQLAQATFVAGAAGTYDDILVQAFDGKAYSGWSSSVHVGVTSGNHAPMVGLPLGASLDVTPGQTLALSSLFRGSDVDGNSLSYLVFDSNPAANSGYVVVGGNVVAPNVATAMTAAQLTTATFVAGAAGTADTIYVQALDGTLNSGWNAGVHILV